MMNAQRVEATVHGIVQGVFFRYNTRLQAERRGIVGTVRNCPDGSVKVTAEGPPRKLKELLAWLRRGPEAAGVERVDARWTEPTGTFTSFRIVR